MKKHIALKLFIAVLAIAVFACALTACEKNKGGYFTVSFTGEGVDIQSQTVVAGGKAVQPKSPEREGYEFVGWTLAGESFSFDTPINSDIVLTAAWRQVVAPQPSDKGDGSKENPYILSSPNDLIEFSERVNTPDEEVNENYYKSYFRLGSDIDMSGYDYTPAGQVFITSDDETINGFMGSFDGAGHKISNLKIVKSLQRKKSYYVGFFGVTERADIRNVTFENIEYDVISGADVEEIEVYYGGVVGEASLTNFSDVTVTGVLDTHLFESNPAYIGGIAGSWRVDGGETAYIAYMENCYSAVETKIGRDDEGQLCALDSAVNGGLVGYLYTYGCAASIVNSVSDGKVYGGKYLGGLIAYISGNYVSVVNCANYSSVIATATEVSYTGGIIGYTYGDNAIMDSYSTGRVKGERATSSYNSYAGNLVGYAVDDDYEKYYSAGIAIINSYYVRNLSASGVMVIDRGTEKDASELTAEWVKTNLRWSDSDMSFEGNKARPATKSINDADFVLDIGGEKYDRKAVGGSYALIGALDAAENKEGEVFFDYMFEGGIRYRFYLPVVKDVYLYAHYQDVSGIVGVYTGTGTLHETRDAGIMVLNDDGTLQWINSTSVGGVYSFDGTHIIINVYNGIGEVSGTIDRTGKISFVADAGITGDVSYEFDKSDLKIFGEYFSDNGDVVTFSGETGISFHTVGINNNDTISGTYSLSEDGNTVTVTGGRLKNFYESMTFTVNADLSLTADIVAKDGVANDFAGVTFNKILNRDYTGRPFVGTYKMPYPNNSSDFGVYQEMYTWEFKADGNVDYTNAFSSKIGSYYVFGEGTVVKVFLEGYIASFVYDSEKNIFYGDLNRGSYAHVYTVITSQSEGSPKALVIDRASGNIVYATDRNAYYMKNKQFSPSSVITCENNFADNDRVVVDGTPYRLIYTRQREGYALVEIGEEEGTYIYNGEAFFIDGIGNVTGSISGTYNVYDDNLIVILTEDDEFIGFDYVAAVAAGNVVALKEKNKYCGVWVQSKTKTDEDGNPYVIDEFYKLYFDGYGHSAFMYYNEDSGKYRNNWGSSKNWVDTAETATGLYCEYNENYKTDWVFYYDMNVVYTKKFGIYGEYACYKRGYTGALTPPSLPSSLVGSYTGEEEDGTAVVFNLKNDLTGSYKGVPFTAVYDGIKSVVFKLSGVEYLFDTLSKELKYGSENVALTLSGAVTEVIPEALCGSWTGVWTGFGATAGDVRTIIIESDGTISYGDIQCIASYDAEKYTVAGKTSDGQYEFSFVWNVETGAMKGSMIHNVSDSEAYSYECNSMTKA